MGSWTKRADGVFAITWADYKATHKDFKGIMDVERPDLPDQESARDNMGRRSLMVYDQGTCLAIEGRGLVIEGAPPALRVVRDEEGEWQVEKADAKDGYEWRRQKWQRSTKVDREEAVMFARSMARGYMGELTYVEAEG